MDLTYLLARAIDLYSLIVLASVVISWVRLDPDNPLVKIVQKLVEPVLQPIRRVIPSIGGLDISPMVLLLALHLVKRGLLSL
jgi:YggT family protein